MKLIDNFPNKNPQTAYVFIAGGIGVTPFRSVIKYLLDKKQAADITLFYIAHTAEEFFFKDLIEKAQKQMGLQPIYVVREPPGVWKGEKGHLNEEMIKKYVADYKSRLFYLSGPQPMIIAYEEMFRKMGIPSSHIKTDFFPGYEQ